MPRQLIKGKDKKAHSRFRVDKSTITDLVFGQAVNGGIIDLFDDNFEDEWQYISVIQGDKQGVLGLFFHYGSFSSRFLTRFSLKSSKCRSNVADDFRSNHFSDIPDISDVLRTKS